LKKADGISRVSLVTDGFSAGAKPPAMLSTQLSAPLVAHFWMHSSSLFFVASHSEFSLKIIFFFDVASFGVVPKTFHSLGL